MPASLSLSFSFEKEDDEGADDPREGARERNCFSITAPAKTAARAKFMAATEVTQRERRSRAYLLSSLLFPGFREKCRGARYTRRCVVYNSKLSERFLSLSQLGEWKKGIVVASAGEFIIHSESLASERERIITGDSFSRSRNFVRARARIMCRLIALIVPRTTNC